MGRWLRNGSVLKAAAWGVLPAAFAGFIALLLAVLLYNMLEEAAEKRKDPS